MFTCCLFCVLNCFWRFHCFTAWLFSFCASHQLKCGGTRTQGIAPRSLVTWRGAHGWVGREDSQCCPVAFTVASVCVFPGSRSSLIHDHTQTPQQYEACTKLNLCLLCGITAAKTSTVQCWLSLVGKNFFKQGHETEPGTVYVVYFSWDGWYHVLKSSR